MLQAAFDYLNTQGETAAQARADLIIAEHRKKQCRARLILASSRGSAGLREAEADSSKEYEQAFLVEAEAAQRVEWHRHQKSRSDAILAAWRTQESSARELTKIR